MTPSVSLLPLSAIYNVVTRARLAAYRRGWLSVSKLPAPVISVGNLSTGGTGKTPLAEWLCRAIARESPGQTESGTNRKVKKICVLMSGYGRENPKSQVVVSNGTEVLASERQAGDEAFLLARNLLGVAAVVCNSNRFAAGHWAIENLGTEVFVLDNGFQHLRLARDLNIVTIDATNPWGGGRLLPAGHLREPITGLSRADCVVITRTEQVEDLTAIRATLERFVGARPIFSSRMAPLRFRRLDGPSVDRKSILSQPLGAFCGVGNPESFFTQLRREGLAPAFTRSFDDHHVYNQSELDALVNQARAQGAEGLITTAKDATKLSALNSELPCYVLEIQISIDEEDRLVDMIRKVQRPMSNVQSPKSRT
jgi:tetraacyldisaccharide 4'-kinase